MTASPVRPPERFLVFGAPVIGEAEIAEVVAVLRGGWLGTGPRAALLEREFAAYKGASHAVAVSSGSAALSLALRAAGVGPGDEVITSALTYCATVNAIIHVGATPVLADVDRRTMNIDPAAVEARICPRTRALIPVHLAGRPCDMDALCAIAERHGLVMIEDCAHAVEAEYRGRKAGTFGECGCFSFFATKNMTTGEGGMVITDREDLAGRIKTLAMHGLSKDAWHRFQDRGYKHYFVTEAGFKANMPDVVAAIGIHQLRRVEQNWVRRREIWERYMIALADLPVELPAAADARIRHAHHLFTILVDEHRAGVSRDAFLEAMAANNIGVGVHYLSIPEHPYYQKTFGWMPADYPNAARIGRSTVSLPISAGLTEGDVGDVIAAVRASLAPNG
jgi:dTDP-4-amino-4,6-dideoxygalactose transaminase